MRLSRWRCVTLSSCPRRRKRRRRGTRLYLLRRRSRIPWHTSRTCLKCHHLWRRRSRRHLRQSLFALARSTRVGCVPVASMSCTFCATTADTMRAQAAATGADPRLQAGGPPLPPPPPMPVPVPPVYVAPPVAPVSATWVPPLPAQAAPVAAAEPAQLDVLKDLLRQLAAQQAQQGAAGGAPPQ